ncbi:MOSC domain-containing protein [Halococcus saccharolyticus]|uniref:MOSC domain-containing protein n=1 Tax=Halococcus saccharolyticus DSM 5350 TaxID=1227455 RepID=M0ML76_9EURY|nr:MOSC domain-containing protein [Halococcus saccharolyticus]EMA45195.1 MOSC domain-containing protein [Halococcus saccharolyticus DSM 5350]
MSGRVRSIHIASEQGAEPESVAAVEAVADAGLRGDRYFSDAGTFAERTGGDLTLIESEALAAVERDDGIELEPGAHRRNITTEGVRLNHYVNHRFRVGEATCLGVELCEPCSYLEQHLGEQGVREALVHRGGLRCRIVATGRIHTGDTIEPMEGESTKSDG